MKKEFFAAALLLCLVLLSVFTDICFRREGCEIGRVLNASGRYAAEADYENALNELSTAASRFGKFASHAHILTGPCRAEEAEILFLELKKALLEKDIAESALVYARLQRMLELYFSSQTLTIENLF